MLRKFLLVGLFVVIEQGKLIQLLGGTIVCGKYIGLGHSPACWSLTRAPSALYYQVPTYSSNCR